MKYITKFAIFSIVAAMCLSCGHHDKKRKCGHSRECKGCGSLGQSSVTVERIA